MSIFNSSFPETIQNELYARQNNLLKRSNLNSLIQPTAWIRMTSGVNVLKNDALPNENGEFLDSDFDNTLAKQNVLSNILGGNENPQGDLLIGYTTKNRHGIRPLPGIISLDCQSFSANGSLRKVTIKFNCWDNSQLEIMEQLYMRPGYVVCVEWGWTQELSTGKKVQFPNFGEKFLESGGEFQNKTLMQLYEIANTEVQSVNGNYDICLGKVQNFNWQLRKDNGYDCEVTIVTYGEILDSWKINNLDLDTTISKKGIPLGNVTKNLDSDGISKYAEGKLCGILNDLNEYACKQKIRWDNIFHNSSTFKVNIPNVGDINMHVSLFNDDIIKPESVMISKRYANLSAYITLGSLCDILNYYMLNSNIVKLSTFESETFACQAHPFQLPCDPNICLIKPQGWIDGIALEQNEKESTSPSSPPGKEPPAYLKNKVNDLFTSYISANVGFVLRTPEIIVLKSDYVKTYIAFLDILEYELKISNSLEISLDNIQQYIENNIDLQNTTNDKDGKLNLKFKTSNKTYTTELINNKQYINLYQFFKLDDDDKKYISILLNLLMDTYLYNNDKDFSLYAKDNVKYLNILNKFNIPESKRNSKWIDPDPDLEEHFKLKLNEILNKPREFSQTTKTAFISKNFKEIHKTLNNRFNNLEPYFIDPQNNHYRKGNISNIYLNLNFIYSLIKPQYETNDKNNKNEISVNTFIKNILSRVQNSIGSINSFEIYADPIDNIAKIIDKDFVESKKVDPFKFDVDFNKSFITNHNIKSQIFPEQNNIIAISTQAPSGKLGLNNKGLINYNIKTRNRFVDITSPNDKNTKIDFEVMDKNNPFYLAVSQLSFYTSLIKFTAKDNTSEATNNVNFSSLNNSLRDLIAYWDSKHSNDAYQSMPMPIVVGLEFPGIAGIRIGNIFNIEGGPKNIFPASFGNNLDFLVRNIGQTIDNNIWSTKIEGYPFKKQ